MVIRASERAINNCFEFMRFTGKMIYAIYKYDTMKNSIRLANNAHEAQHTVH